MKNKFSARVFAFVVFIFSIAGTVFSQTAERDNDFRIEAVRENVYRFVAGNYVSVFMVAETEIVVADPISTKAAAWLKSELARRFKKPVRYVIYSHNHPDHAYGGEQFDNSGVQFVAHELAREDLIRTKAQTRIPNLVFNDELTLISGSNKVHLRYHGVNNGRGSISMLFEPAGVLHVVDWIIVGRMPYQNLQGYDIEGMIRSTREVLKMDFAVFVGGHADTGTKKEIARYLEYLETLYAAVLDGIRAGKSLETLQKEIRLDRFKDFKMYEEWLPLNVKGVYETLVNQSYMLMRPDVAKPD